MHTSLRPRHILLPLSSWGQGPATPQASPRVVKGLCCWARALLFLAGAYIHFNKALLGIAFAAGTGRGAGHGDFFKDLPDKVAAVQWGPGEVATGRNPRWKVMAASRGSRGWGEIQQSHTAFEKRLEKLPWKLWSSNSTLRRGKVVEGVGPKEPRGPSPGRGRSKR